MQFLYAVWSLRVSFIFLYSFIADNNVKKKGNPAIGAKFMFLKEFHKNSATRTNQEQKKWIIISGQSHM